MKQMHLFVDTHDKTRGTFPTELSEEQFRHFYALYQAACGAEGVVNLKVDVGLGEGRAFCLNLAPDAEAVRRTHERVGLAYDSITEVQTASPGSLFFNAAA